VKLTPQSTVVVRTPAFPAALLQALYDADDAKAALLAQLRERPDVRATLRLASPSLDHGIAKWIERPGTDEGAAHSAFAYLARCATRSTPLAACAAVSQVTLGATTELRCAQALRRRTRPDTGWLYAIGSRYESRLKDFPPARVFPSGLSYLKNGRLEVADISRSELRFTGRSYSPVAIPTAMNPTPALETIVRGASGGASIGQLSTDAAESLGARVDDVAAFINKLIETGVLLSEFRVPLLADPAEALHHLLTMCDPSAAERLARLREHLAAIDEAALSSAPAALESLAPIAAELAPAEHYWQIDAARDMSGHLDERIAREAADAISSLVRIARPIDTNGQIARAFIARYNESREIGVLELLDPSDGLAFDGEAARERGGWSQADGYLLALAGGAIARGDREIVLGEADFAVLALPDSGRRAADDDLPEGYEALLHVVRTPDGHDVPAFTGIIRGGLGWASARFHDLLALEAAPDEDGPEIVAEFVSLPHARRAANVAVRRTTSAYEVACGVVGSTDPERLIKMDDIVVGVDRGRTYLRSKRLGKRLRVRQTHAMNTSASSRFAKFFAWVDGSPLESPGFSWHAAAALPYHPRVRIGRTIVSLASWLLPREHALEFESEASVAWRATWRLPRRIYLSMGDNRLMLDTSHALARAQLAKAASKLGRGGCLTVQEALPDFGDETVYDETGAGYFAEFVVGFRLEREQARPPASPPVLAVPLAPAAYLRAPGSEWTFAKFYIAPERTDYFLERHLAPFASALEQIAQRLFFIRYGDPDHHVRFRAMNETPGAAEEVMLRVVRQARAWVEAGILTRVALDTYDREIERYGGPAAIDAAERAFATDSMRIMQCLESLRRTGDRELWLLTDAAQMIRCLFDDDRGAHAWLRRVVGRRSHIKPDVWKRIRQARQALALRDPVWQALAADLTAALAAVPEGRRDAVARAHYHMHANRLGLRISDEERLLEAALALFDGLIASQGTA
jgi:thiopeptide-type bacteriocin biosynthesis protein